MPPNGSASCAGFGEIVVKKVRVLRTNENFRLSASFGCLSTVVSAIPYAGIRYELIALCSCSIA